MKELFMVLSQERYSDGTVLGIYDNLETALSKAKEYAESELDSNDTDLQGYINWVEVFRTELNQDLGEFNEPVQAFGFDK